MSGEATIRVTCSTCGDVTVVAEEITLRRCIDQPTASTYRFRCPDCQKIEVKQAHPQVVSLLEMTLVQAEAFYFPVPEKGDGPPISHDDLLDFHEALGAA